MTSYEKVLDLIDAIPTGTAKQDRTITWLTEAMVVGFARNSMGHLELFLAGVELKPLTSTVKSAMQHHRWFREGQPPLDANRILLPAFGHFDQVGAFIATELIRGGADVNLQGAFAVTEPLIELAITRLEMSESAILGLVGELLLIDAMCRRVDAPDVRLVVQSWGGWRRSTRDLKWNGTGVEIKTTTRVTSSHVVQGIHQIEPAMATGDEADEDRLFLVSIGLCPAEPGVPAVSVSSLVESILGRLRETGASSFVDEFLKRVSVYGIESGIGYEHVKMANEALFAAGYTVNFFRAYDMSDSAIQVLRRDDVASHQHVDIRSLVFNVNLPDGIRPGNPIIGVYRVAEALLEP